MPPVQSFAALVVLYQAVSASPAAPLSARDAPAFRVDQVSAGFKAYQPPAVGLLQTYKKYAKVSNVTVPPTVVQAAAAQQSGAVTATPEGKSRDGRVLPQPQLTSLSIMTKRICAQ